MISDVLKPRTCRCRDRRSLAEEQKSIKSVITCKDSKSSVTMGMERNLSNNSKETEATKLCKVTNAQLHSNNKDSTYTSHYTFKSPTYQEIDKNYSTLSHSSSSRNSEESGILSSGGHGNYGNHDRNRYRRGYYSEGSALSNNNTQDTSEDNVFSSSSGFRSTSRQNEDKEDSASSSHSRRGNTNVPSEIKYRHTNGLGVKFHMQI